MTKLERQHLNKVASLGCIVCLLHLDCESPAEIHHIRSGMGMSMRNNNFNVLPCCHLHHRSADGSSNFNGEISYHKNPNLFEEKYGTELELLEIVKRMIE